MRILLAAAAFLLAGASVAAPDSPATWMARILDPTTIGVTPWPGGEPSRKFAVDTIRLEPDPDKQIAIYLAPLEKLSEASAHFRKELGVEPKVTGEGSEFETHRFAAPDKRLEVEITRSPWSTGNLQITMKYDPAPAAEAEAPPAK